jgi:hypothetical protein
VTSRIFPRWPAAARAATVTAVVTVATVAPALPALASKRDDGDEPGAAMGALEALLLFVGVPIAAFVVISLLVWVTSSGGQRYRPGAAWTAGNVWFGGPEQPQRALQSAQPTSEEGGARARW